MTFLTELLCQGLQWLLVLAVAPLMIGLIRKTKARLLRRQGPPIIQPWRDILRLFRKEVVIAEQASWFYCWAPYAIFSVTWVAASLIPTFATGLIFNWSADLIAISAFLATAKFLLALAGMDIGTSFGGIGSSRETFFGSLAEPATIMFVFIVSLIAGSTQLSEIAAFMVNHTELRVSLGFALIAFLIVLIAENGRIPVDNPATHLELTMVHEAMILEYSGRHLAIIELAASIKLLLYFSIIFCIFLPWGLAPHDAGPSEILIGIGTYLLKLAAGSVALALFEVSIAKMRIFMVPGFLGAALILGLLGTILVFATRGL